MPPKKHPFDQYSILWTILNLTSLLQIGSRGTYTVQPSSATNAASTNYLGASIFISYIIAALILTYLITGELDTVYRRVLARKQGSSPQWRQFKTFVALSSISFGVLSWNMLNFLITSYNAWSSKQRPAVASSSHFELGVSIHQWTIHSTLFLDFARSLCATQSGYWWVMQALMATMTTNVIMQAGGKRWKVKTGYYVAIGQILPISLAMNLFSVAIVLAQMEGEETTVTEVKKEKGAKADAVHGMLPLWMLGVVMVLYRGLLYLLPRTPDQYQFMAMVLLTRFALYTVSLIELPVTRALDKRLARSHLAVLRTYGVMQLISITSRQEWSIMMNQVWSLVEGPAVAALSVDFVLWFVSVWVLNSSQLLGSTGRKVDGVEDSIW